jgi:hypothetical protein
MKAIWYLLITAGSAAGCASEGNTGAGSTIPETFSPVTGRQAGCKVPPGDYTSIATLSYGTCDTIISDGFRKALTGLTSKVSYGRDCGTSTSTDTSPVKDTPCSATTSSSTTGTSDGLEATVSISIGCPSNYLNGGCYVAYNIAFF